MPSSKTENCSVNNVSYQITSWKTAGRWLSHPFIYSLVITCDRLDVENAIHPDLYKLSYRNYEKVTYQCVEGFTGKPTRTCRESRWTGASQCTGKNLLWWLWLVNVCASDVKLSLSLEITCTPKIVPEADIVGSSKPRYTYKEEVEYVCKEGYGGRFTLTCASRGWVGEKTCKSK